MVQLCDVAIVELTLKATQIAKKTHTKLVKDGRLQFSSKTCLSACSSLVSSLSLPQFLRFLLSSLLSSLALALLSSFPAVSDVEKDVPLRAVREEEPV